MTTSRRGPSRPGYAAVLALLAVLALAGCGGDAGSGGGSGGAGGGKGRQSAAPASTPSAKLATYKGDGFSVGYPRDWQRVQGHTVVKGAAFEVGVKSPDGKSMQSSLDVLVNDGIPWPLSRVADDFVAFSRTTPSFQLLSSKETAVDGEDGWEVRKSYTTPEGLRLRQVDLFTKTGDGTLVNVRLIFRAEGYGAAEATVDAVHRSFRFTR